MIIAWILHYLSVTLIMMVAFMLLEVNLPKIKDKLMFTVLAVFALYLYSIVAVPDVHWFFFVISGLSFFTSLYVAEYLRGRK